MQSIPLVSVIIPCYKQAHFLNEAIKSVFAQSHPIFEIIVVDDGSPDNTAEVSASHAEVRYIWQENQGRSAARNIGAKRSSGKYLVFLDADDRLLPHALEAGLSCLTANPECAYSSGHYINIAADGSPLTTPTQPVVTADHYLSLLQGGECIWLPAAVMFRRSVFESIGGFEASSEPTEDFDIYLRITKKFSACCHGKVIAEYRQHPTNTTHQSGLMLRAAIRVLHSQRRYVKKNPIYEKAYLDGINLFQNFYGESLIRTIERSLRVKRYSHWRQSLHDILILLQYYPQGVFKLINYVFSSSS